LTPDSLFDVQKKGIRNGYFVMNTSTLNAIRKFKSTTNEYLFQAGIGGVAPSMIAGKPYILAEDMPDIASNAFPVAYGDFRTGYYIVDNVNLTFLEDKMSQAIDGLNRYIAIKRVGGKVVQSEVLKKIKIST
jgi:HK97 family phage major capsid protein